MAFENGHIKLGGREVGTTNKLTKEVRAVLKEVVNNELCNLPESLNKLDTKERLEIMIRLLPYVLPKVKPIYPTAWEG